MPVAMGILGITCMYVFQVLCVQVLEMVLKRWKF